MCVMSAPKAPPPVVVPPAPAASTAQPVSAKPEQAPEASDMAAKTAAKQRALKASGSNNTLVTGAQGLTQAASTGTKSLYGQ